MQADLNTILPEIVIAVYAMLALIGAVYTSKDKLAGLLTYTTAGLFLIVAAWIGLDGNGAGTAFGGMFVDDALFNQIKPEDLPGEWVYDHPFFIILNVSVGGNYVGYPTDQTPFPQTMLIDWVKVYKEN